MRHKINGAVLRRHWMPAGMKTWYQANYTLRLAFAFFPRMMHYNRRKKHIRIRGLLNRVPLISSHLYRFRLPVSMAKKVLHPPSARQYLPVAVGSLVAFAASLLLQNQIIPSVFVVASVYRGFA